MAATRRRLFFALWPDEAVRDAVLAAADAAAQRAGIRGRRTPAERVHLTLLFLGDLDPSAEAHAGAVAGSLRVPRFELSLDRVGSFPRARVLWVGARQAPPALALLHRGLRDGMGTRIDERDRRTLVPHLTCYRDASRPLRMAPIPPIAWTVDRFALVHSEPGRAAPQYHVVSHWPLHT